jgi:hypothetical protein
MNYKKPLYSSLLPFKQFLSNTTNAIVLYNSVKQTVDFPTESEAKMLIPNQWRTQEFCSGGGGSTTNSVEDRENGGDLGAVAP